MVNLDSPMSLLALQIASLVAESVLYGAFVVLCITTSYLRLSRYSASNRPKLSRIVWNPVVLSTFALFVLCTTHWAISISRFFAALLSSSSTIAILQNLETFSMHTQSVSNAFTLLAIWIGDAVLIYRLWVIWNRSWRVIALPLLLWLGIVVIGSVLIYMFFQPVSKYTAFCMNSPGWFTANWVFTSAINIYCTGTIQHLENLACMSSLWPDGRETFHGKFKFC
ncbi:hypothetical protein C8F01DRAFT_1249662 [Mycena amicta]|nr:hypothetical protein C8F01DRAFT_1249662 [Mycena amicta]